MSRQITRHMNWPWIRFIRNFLCDIYYSAMAEVRLARIFLGCSEKKVFALSFSMLFETWTFTPRHLCHSGVEVVVQSGFESGWRQNFDVCQKLTRNFSKYAKFLTKKNWRALLKQFNNKKIPPMDLFSISHTESWCGRREWLVSIC